MRRARTDGSYASANDPRVLVGLGGGTDTTESVREVVVRWPGGAEERWTGLDARRWHTLTRGAGEPVP